MGYQDLGIKRRQKSASSSVRVLPGAAALASEQMVQG